MKKGQAATNRVYGSEAHPHKEIREIVAESEEKVRRFFEELKSSRHITRRSTADQASKRRRVGA
jgi:hypothetical protein